MSGSLSRRLMAESIGTALLVAFGAGSVVAALGAGDGELEGYAALVGIALTFGLVVALAIYAFGSTSGGHINPAVTAALVATRRFPAAEAGPYMAAQLAGAVVGGLAVLAVFGGEAADLGAAGSTQLAEGVGFLRGVAAEAVGTFLLMTAIMALAVDTRAPSGWAGLMIGLAVTCAILATGPVAGASLNPARSFGPLVAATLGGGEAPWGDFIVYVIGPVLGALAAAFVYDAVAEPRRAEEAAEPAQGALGDIEGRREDEPVGGRRAEAIRDRG